MNSMRCICLASGLGLLLMAGPMLEAAPAQSAQNARIRAMLLGLQQDAVESLVDVTPELLSLQDELVAALRLEWEGRLEEARGGQRTMEDVLSSELDYFRELEALQVMKARLNNKGISEKEILRVRITARSDALAVLREQSAMTRNRHVAGEVTYADVAAMRARVVKAEIVLAALKQAAGK